MDLLETFEIKNLWKKLFQIIKLYYLNCQQKKQKKDLSEECMTHKLEKHSQIEQQ
jgi:hypothetical protein